MNKIQHLDGKEEGMYGCILAAIVSHMWIHMNEVQAKGQIVDLGLSGNSKNT